jgi:hypothetical protein
VSLTALINPTLYFRISPQIFVKFEMALIGFSGD